MTLNQFRSIPGYEGLYSMSSDGLIRSDKNGRVKKITSLQSGQKTVVLYKNGVPHCYTLKSLLDLTFRGTPISKNKNAAKAHSKQVMCLDTGQIFNSCSELCKHFGFDYKKFRQSLPSGTFKGHQFKVI